MEISIGKSDKEEENEIEDGRGHRKEIKEGA